MANALSRKPCGILAGLVQEDWNKVVTIKDY